MRRITKPLLLVFFWMLCASSVVGQQLVQTIRGEVRDADSNAPIEGVNVIIRGSDPLVGAVTNEAGNFRIENVPIGTYDLLVTYVGYESLVLPNVKVTTGKEVVLQVRVTESLTVLDEVVVEGDNNSSRSPINEFAVISSLSFSMEESGKYAGTFDDPARMVTTFAGVVGGGGSDDVDNEIIIRGNSPRNLLWRVEGIEVPSPNHFTDEGASSGSISMLSSNMLATSDFFTSAFPAEYGNAISGVFDIRLRQGNNQQREYALRAGVLGLDASAEGPFKKGGEASYLVNYRYSTLALLNEVGIELVDNALPVFQDLAFNIVLPTAAAGEFSIFGFGGLSKDEEFDELLISGREVRAQEEEFNSDLGVVGLRHNYPFSAKTYLETVATFSAQRITFERDAIVNSNLDFRRVNNEDFTNYAQRISVLLNHKFNARHLVRTGVIYSHLQYDLLSQVYNFQNEQLEDEVNSDGSTGVLQSYIAWKYRISDKLVLNSGLHSMYFRLNDKATLEPRAGINYQLTTRQFISAGVGLHSRRESLSTYLSGPETVVGSNEFVNENLEISKAIHYVIGYDNYLNDHLRFKVEAYYQDLYDIPVLNNTYYSIINLRESAAAVPLVNEGTGENYGVEVTLARTLANDYYFNTNVSLYKSRYTGGDGVERNTKFDGNYIINLLGGKDFNLSSDKVLNVNLRGILAGGQRFIPILENESAERGFEVLDFDRAYEERLPDYFRADFQIGYTVNNPKNTWQIRLDVQNLTNRQNVREVNYSPLTQRAEFTRRGQIIPVLSAQVKF
ncbi:carboxypeptidase regulatory-like domain-containing protein [Roseivirga sp. BDSF3-8]|uniref:TonB-dependent receptor n=1 Tax=Roseivirga sp. BDSF3-8 TaxID=3241598 RepID=UPI0035321803